MSGWTSAESRLRHLGKKAEVVVRGKLVSVVYFDEVNGVRLIEWPKYPAAGVLCVPRPMGESEWGEKYGLQHN